MTTDRTVGRRLLLTLALVLAVLPAVTADAGTAAASGHGLCVLAEGQGQGPAQVDIREVCAVYGATELSFAMRVAEPTDPHSDPAWDGETQVTWVFDTFASTFGHPSGQLSVFTVDGQLRVVATIFDHTSPACPGAFDFDGQWYLAAFDPRCLDLPVTITFAGFAQYDTDAGDPESLHRQRLPAGEHVDGEGAMAGPISSDGWTCPGVPNADLESGPFDDRRTIPAVHRRNVDCAASHGIVTGFGDNTYRPADAVRRDQMASLLLRTLDAAGVALPAPGDGFTDVPAASPHHEAVNRLAAAGIVQGGPGGAPADSFGPALRVRRDQMASFVVRAAEYATGAGVAGDDQAFADVPPDNPHFAHVNAAAERGLIQGHPDGTFRPAGPVRRDQTATFSVRLLDWLGTTGEEGRATAGR